MSHHIVAYLSLNDFIQDVIADDNQVRVEVIQRNTDSKAMPGGLVQWLVIVTAKTTEGDLAMTSILVGEAWKIAIKEEPWHQDNAEKALLLVKAYLERTMPFYIAPGVFDPKDVMDNIVRASAGLWHFEDHRLVANDLVTDDDLARADQAPDDQTGDTKCP